MINTFAFQGVDAIQSAKKQFVTTFVQHEGIKDALVSFVDAQAQYTKDAITASTVTATKVAEVFTDRTPYVEVSKKMTEYFAPFFTTGTTSSKKAK
jgi:hypothetical protein